MSCVVELSWKRKTGITLVVTTVLLMATTITKAQTSTNQVQTVALPASPSSDNSGFDVYATGGWGGERRRLVDEGISLNTQLILEGFHNFQGGLKTETEGALTFDLNLALDTEKAFHWHGGKFYIDLEDHAGQNPSAVLTGDLQTFDKLNTLPYFQIYELLYRQELFNGWFRLKLGKWDANDDFSVIDNGLAFLNASDIVSPTILAFPTTPDPMPGAAVYLTPGKFLYAQLAAFYANQSDTFGDITGHPQSVQPTKYGTLLLGETGLRWHYTRFFAAGGDLKLGVWEHTGTFTRLEGGWQKGASGYYAILDQTLWQPAGKPEQGRGVRSFMVAGKTQASITPIDWNIAGGITWTGPVPVRPDDILGFSANYAHLSPQARLPHSYELALEWFYQVSVTKWSTIHPDVQFIIHPGGQYPDAVVGTLDVTIQF